MTDDQRKQMEAEITMVRVKHHGQYPYEKGHSDEGTAFFSGIAIGLFIVIVTNAFQSNIWEKWSIKNGYASYNAVTGKLVYKNQ